MRRLKRLMRRRFINSETTEACVGAVSLDVTMARQAGWSEKAIARAYERLGKIARREMALSHRNGPVKGCACITCDLKLATKDLPDEPYVSTRKSWIRRGLWHGKR